MRLRNEAFSESEVVEWGLQLCDALGYLHDKGIIYRDLKPDSILLTPSDGIRLIGVFLAFRYEQGNQENLPLMGTRGYASPEHYASLGELDPRSDVYSLGATLFELVTGRKPTERGDSFSLPPIRTINPNLSEILERIIAKATQRNPAERYQSCAELSRDLEGVNNLLHASPPRILFARFARAIRGCG